MPNDVRFQPPLRLDEARPSAFRIHRVAAAKVDPPSGMAAIGASRKARQCVGSEALMVSSQSMEPKQTV